MLYLTCNLVLKKLGQEAKCGRFTGASLYFGVFISISSLTCVSKKKKAAKCRTVKTSSVLCVMLVLCLES